MDAGVARRHTPFLPSVRSDLRRKAPSLNGRAIPPTTKSLSYGAALHFLTKFKAIAIESVNLYISDKKKLSGEIIHPLYTAEIDEPNVFNYAAETKGTEVFLTSTPSPYLFYHFPFSPF